MYTNRTTLEKPLHTTRFHTEIVIAKKIHYHWSIKGRNWYHQKRTPKYALIAKKYNE